MDYVLGIDSGGTKFLVKAVGMDGRELAEYEGHPAGLYRFSRNEAVRTIQDNLEMCIGQAGLTKADCRAIVCGTTGIDSEEDRQEVEEIYRLLPGFSCPALCVNDAEVALYAVTGGTGVVVISGTGSIAFGRNSSGRTGRCGACLLYTSIPVRDHSDHRIFSEPAHGERVQGLFKGGAVFGRMAEGRPECAV